MISKRILALLAVAGAVVGFLAATFIPPAVAHAQGAVVATATPGLSLPEWIGIGLAALAGIKAVVDAALAFFRYLAPKTKTTVDDTIRDDLQLAHDKLDALTGLVQGIKPVVVQNVVAPVPAKTGGAA